MHFSASVACGKLTASRTSDPGLLVPRAKGNGRWRSETCCSTGAAGAASQVPHAGQLVTSFVLPTHPPLSRVMLTHSHTDLLELALLLYFRHVNFYLDPERAGREFSSTQRPEFGLGLAESLNSSRAGANGALVHGGGSVSAFDLRGLREALANDFEATAERLAEVEFVSSGPEC